MQNEFNFEEDSELEAYVEKLTGGTLYSLAMEVMKDYVEVNLELCEQTNGFAIMMPEH